MATQGGGVTTARATLTTGLGGSETSLGTVKAFEPNARAKKVTAKEKRMFSK
jgi:hypothetical protein